MTVSHYLILTSIFYLLTSACKSNPIRTQFRPQVPPTRAPRFQPKIHDFALKFIKIPLLAYNNHEPNIAPSTTTTAMQYTALKPPKERNTLI